MAGCGLVNLGSCLPQKFFELILNLVNAPIRPFLELTLNLLSEPININLFLNMWVIIVYILSMSYGLLLLSSGFNFMISGYDSAKREKAKEWLRNIVIMIILIQASFFIYELAINLSSILTSTTLTLVNPDFFLIGTEGIDDLGMAIILGFLYVVTLLFTSLVLAIRYAFVAIGVVFLPIAIFFYFFPPMKQYGSLILNSLGTAIFVTFFDVIILAGFSKLVEIEIFGNMKILILICAFLLISLLMLFLMLFGIIKSAFSVYSDIKRFKL